MMVDEYIKREDARDFLKMALNDDREVDYANDRFDEIPAADVVEVVRCRDCRHRDPEDKKCDSGALERAGCVFSVDDDYFCADGERKDGDGDA